MKKNIINYLSVNLINALIGKGLDNNKKDIYVYGLEILISNVMTILCSIFIMGMFGFLVESCIYWGVFVITRECFHGYHFKKFYQCFLLSIVTGFIGTFGSTFLYSYIGISGIHILAGLVLVALVISVIIKKRDSDLIRSYILIIIQWLVAYWLQWTGQEYYSVFILSAEVIALLAYIVKLWRTAIKSLVLK